LGKKPFPVPFDSPQIPHDLAYSWTWSSALRGRWLGVWGRVRSRDVCRGYKNIRMPVGCISCDVQVTSTQTLHCTLPAVLLKYGFKWTTVNISLVVRSCNSAESSTKSGANVRKVCCSGARLRGFSILQGAKSSAALLAVF
jgi:hypothetical protein